MRKILLLICILSITIGAKAQLFGKHWDEGSYYDLKGTRHSGLISWSPPDAGPFGSSADKIYYKSQKNAGDVKIKSVDIQSFNLGLDSFTVTKNKKFEDNPFLSVTLNNNDSCKLYCSMVTRRGPGFGMGVGSIGVAALTAGARFSYTKKTYYFGDNADNIVKLEKKNFIDVMSKIMADKPLVVESIKNKKLRLGDMDDLLFFYKNGFMKPKETEEVDRTVAD